MEYASHFTSSFDITRSPEDKIIFDDDSYNA